jgi:hypothetical protein
MHAYFFAKAKHSILEYGKNLSADLNFKERKIAITVLITTFFKKYCIF